MSSVSPSLVEAAARAMLQYAPMNMAWDDIRGHAEAAVDAVGDALRLEGREAMLAEGYRHPSEFVNPHPLSQAALNPLRDKYAALYPDDAASKQWRERVKAEGRLEGAQAENARLQPIQQAKYAQGREQGRLEGAQAEHARAIAAIETLRQFHIDDHEDVECVTTREIAYGEVLKALGGVHPDA